MLQSAAVCCSACCMSCTKLQLCFNEHFFLSLSFCFSFSLSLSLPLTCIDAAGAKNKKIAKVVMKNKRKTLQYTAPHCNTLMLGVPKKYNTLQHTATCNNILMLKKTYLKRGFFKPRSVLQRVVVCCSVPASCCSVVVVCCSVLQCVLMWYSGLQCVAVCCSVLQCAPVCSSVP